MRINARHHQRAQFRDKIWLSGEFYSGIGRHSNCITHIYFFANRQISAAIIASRRHGGILISATIYYGDYIWYTQGCSTATGARVQNIRAQIPTAKTLMLRSST